VTEIKNKKKVIRHFVINFSCDRTGKQTYRSIRVATVAGAKAQQKPKGT